MQKRLLILEIGLFIVLLVSWFLPYAYEITPWKYMTHNLYETWQFTLLVPVAMFTIGFVLIDLFIKEESMVRRFLNGMLSAIYAAIIIGYFSEVFEHSFLLGEMIVAILFSLILFFYSFLIQKGTSFTRNIILCTMGLPIVFHLLDLYDQFQLGGWLLSGSFFALVIVAAIRPFVAPKLD